MSGPSVAALPEIEALDRLAPDAFAAALAPLFEGAPRLLARLAAARPFGSVEALFEQARVIAQGMPEAEQIELIDAHPRLGAPPGSVSALSYVEQGYDRQRPVDRTIDVAGELDRLNAAYEARFGFRYCVFVAGRPRAQLLDEFAEALERDRDAEIRRAIEAIVDIAVDRHAKLGSEVRE